MHLAHLLFDFRGRLARRPFNVASAVVMVFSGMLAVPGGGIAVFPGFQVSPLDAIGWWMTAALLAKRYHDLGMSGWWSLLPISVMVLFVASGVLGYLGGTKPEMAGTALMLAAVGLAAGLWAAFHAFKLVSVTGDEAANAFGPAPGTPAAVVPAAAVADERQSDWMTKALEAAGQGAAAVTAATADQQRARPTRAAPRVQTAPTFGRRAAAR